MLTPGTYKVLDWDKNNLKLDGGIGWISKEELGDVDVIQGTNTSGIGSIVLSEDTEPQFSLISFNQEENEKNNDTNNQYGQQGISFSRGENLIYQSIQYNNLGEKFYTVNFSDTTCYIPDSKVSTDNPFLGETLIGYQFEDLPSFPTAIALTLNDPLLEKYSGYIVKANANYFDKNSVLNIEVENDSSLNRTVFVIDDTLQTQDQLGILFKNDLDKDFWGKRNIKAEVIEKEMSLTDFYAIYMKEEVIEFG